MLYYLRLFCAAFAAFVFSALAYADEGFFYSDEYVSIPWPENVAFSSCSEELRAKAGAACRLIGENGELGAVFLTIHQGYALGTPQALQKHLEDSEAALSQISRIHVMQTRIVHEEPLMGMMEVLRNDGTLNSIKALNGAEIRQTSLLIPADNALAQVFIYLPMNADFSANMLDALVQNMTAEIQVHKEPGVLDGDENAQPEGALALMPRAACFGIAIAALVILIFSIRARLARARRREEDRKLQIQLEACSNTEKDGEFSLGVTEDQSTEE